MIVKTIWINCALFVQSLLIQRGNMTWTAMPRTPRACLSYNSWCCVDVPLSLASVPGSKHDQLLISIAQLRAIVTSALDPSVQNHIKTRTWNQPSKISVAPPCGSHVTHLLMSKRLLSSRPAMVGPDTKAGRSHWHTWEKWRQGANLESI